jgi:hypothetical protein
VELSTGERIGLMQAHGWDECAHLTSHMTKCDTGAVGLDVAAYSGMLMLHEHGGRQGHSLAGVGLVHVYCER